MAGLMIFCLKRYSQVDFQFQNTLDIVNRIIRLYIEAGTLTASAAFLTFVYDANPRPVGQGQCGLDTPCAVRAARFRALGAHTDCTRRYDLRWFEISPAWIIKMGHGHDHRRVGSSIPRWRLAGSAR